MARETKIIQFGSYFPNFTNLLKPNFYYENIAQNRLEDAVIDEQFVFKNQQLNSKFRNDLFVITDQKYLNSENKTILNQLPANNIIINADLVLSVDVERILSDKNAQFVHYLDEEDFAKKIKRDFFAWQLGYKLNYDNVQFHPSFEGQVEQLGHNYLEVKDADISHFEPIMTWRQVLPIAPKTRWDVTIEHEIQNQDTELVFRVSLISTADNKVYFTHDAKGIELDRPINVEVQPQGGFLTVELLAKGVTVDFKVGQVHVRQARNGHGELLVGESELFDSSQMNQSILYYFDPGDMKPPLNVYFSGYRTAEGVEGVFMMRKLKAPSLIFGDPRILGGSFYVGSKQLERKIVQTIQNQLKRLNFDPHDLILSGLSMGSFGAMYYSTILNPAWVIVGKPLSNIGEVAANERINRPGQFPTALDVVLKLTGGLEQRHIKQANRILWEEFKKTDHKQTNFAFAYMKNDDYDPRGYSDVVEYLRQKGLHSKVLHKGFIGRHNDDSKGINDWFLKQYRNVLNNEYRRNFDE